MRWLAGIFLIVHAAVHITVWATPATTAQPFDARRSWLAVRFDAEDRARTVARAAAISATLIFTIAGIGVLAEAGSAPGLAVVGALLSLLLTVAYFNPWLTINLAINVVIIYLAVR